MSRDVVKGVGVFSGYYRVWVFVFMTLGALVLTGILYLYIGLYIR